MSELSSALSVHFGNGHLFCRVTHHFCPARLKLLLSPQKTEHRVLRVQPATDANQSSCDDNPRHVCHHVARQGHSQPTTYSQPFFVLNVSSGMTNRPGSDWRSPAYHRRRSQACSAWTDCWQGPAGAILRMPARVATLRSTYDMRIFIFKHCRLGTARIPALIHQYIRR